MMPDKIELDVVTPERRVLTETVDSVILPGEQGYFGVLPMHAPMLARLMVGELSFEAAGRKVRMAVCGGYAEVLRDRVRVLADTCELADEIDVTRAERARDRALEVLDRKKASKHEFELAEYKLKKALTRIRVRAGGLT